jgi:NADPH-dependent ferric siderophore reductase
VDPRLVATLCTVGPQTGFQAQGAEERAHESDHDLVDLLDMTPDRMLDLVGVPGGPLADATLWRLEVIEAGALTPTLHRVVLTAPGLDRLRYLPGQDLMLRVPQGGDRVVNRRYTIRSFDATRAAVIIDVSLHGAGPGTDWIRGAGLGDRIEAIGPRGKITLRESADWHLFVGDETGLPGALAMIEALPSASRATAVFEIDTPADEQEPHSRQMPRLDLLWLHRSGRSAPGDASLLVEALADVAMPEGLGHAYVAAEAGVVRSIQRVLAEGGLPQEQISAKAYWRRGLPNAEHGEPARQ